MKISEFADDAVRETSTIIYGKEEQTRLILAALLADGHILLDDLPGVGKTTLVKALSIVLGLSSSRIQFVPDLRDAIYASSRLGPGKQLGEA